MQSEILVIGGGPAGLMAAGMAAQKGVKPVKVLEKMSQPARKLRITGKGRCNLTNIAPLSEFLSHIGPNPKFLRPAFSSFFAEDLVEFFNSLGVKTQIERGGRVFPVSENAGEIADALLRWNQHLGVELLTSIPVKEICIENQMVQGVKLENGETILSKKIILATGGASYPATGSSGDGYRLARQAGHSVTPIRPALVPLTTASDTAQQLQGLSLKNVNVSVWVEGKKTAQAFGEMLFTHFGLSGPVILSLSRLTVNDIDKHRKVIFSIDLKPALDLEKLIIRIQRDWDEHGKMSFKSSLKLLLPQSLIAVCLQQTQIPAEKPCNQLNAIDKKRLALWLKDFRFEITGHRSFNEAIVTAGGVCLNEINPSTMESKIVKGLYFAGEVLDLDADTGGYNLQIAFSTGRLAGISAAQNLF